MPRRSGTREAAGQPVAREDVVEAPGSDVGWLPPGEPAHFAADLVLAVLLVDHDLRCVALAGELGTRVLASPVELAPVIVLGKVEVAEHDAAACEHSSLLQA